MLEFILERYNYWIVIVLMMTGLYIVYARGNLVKKIVGLNVFQTSVFIFYITIGKIAGGTAPIYFGGELDHGDDHGGGHDDGHGADDHGAGDHGDAYSADHSADHAAGANGTGAHEVSGLHDTESLHEKVANQFPSTNEIDLKAALEKLEPSESVAVEGLHETVEGASKIANQMDGLAEKAKGFEIAPAAPDGVPHGAEDGAHAAAGHALDAAASHGEIIYTNPLPHVLILTAIVVGVAGTAVGLALAVRIREAYGTIEEDELEVMDNIAEFGEGSEFAPEARA